MLDETGLVLQTTRWFGFHGGRTGLYVDVLLLAHGSVVEMYLAGSEGVVGDDVGDWWSSGRMRLKKMGKGELCMLLQVLVRLCLPWSLQSVGGE